MSNVSSTVEQQVVKSISDLYENEHSGSIYIQDPENNDCVILLHPAAGSIYARGAPYKKEDMLLVPFFGSVTITAK